MTSIIEVYRRWPTRQAAISHLETVRWPDGPECPYCAWPGVSRHREALRDDRWQCQKCLRSFSVTVGTIFHNSHIDLQRWYLLISLMLYSEKACLSASQAARDLKIRRQTVLSMMRRISSASDEDKRLLSALVQR